MKCENSNDKEDEKFFSEGRKCLNDLEDKNFFCNKWNFGFYSRFFYKRSKIVDETLSKINFKKEYFELAKKISDSIGDFFGIHIRGTDHRKVYNLTDDKVLETINTIKNKNIPIVICTDEPKNYSNEAITLHHFIIENFKNEFIKLPFYDDTVFSLINLLVMTNSKYFIGTPGSTYTGFIHRTLYKKNKHNFDLFETNEISNYGPYSWNKFEMDTYMKSWWREYPESKLDF